LGVQYYRTYIIIYIDNKKVKKPEKVEKAEREETEVENTDSSVIWAVTLLMIKISFVEFKYRSGMIVAIRVVTVRALVVEVKNHHGP
jgi:hypothetical protein